MADNLFFSRDTKVYVGLSTIRQLHIATAGAGYASAPAITITGGGAATQATATCTINGSGEVDSVTVTSPGAGYTSTPTVSVAAAPGGGTDAVIRGGAGIWELPIIDGFSMSQGTNTTEVTLNEMSNAAGVSRRGRQLFTDSYAPAEWSFSTYMRPFLASGTVAGGGSDNTARQHVVEEVLWAQMVGDGSYIAPVDGTSNTIWKDGLRNVHPVPSLANQQVVEFEDSDKAAIGEFDLYFNLGENTSTTKTTKLVTFSNATQIAVGEPYGADHYQILNFQAGVDAATLKTNWESVGWEANRVHTVATHGIAHTNGANPAVGDVLTVESGDLPRAFVLNITTAGAGYTSAPAITITGGGASSNATATCTISGGVVNSVTITSAGAGYTSLPTVSVAAAPSGGTNAVIASADPGFPANTGSMSPTAGTNNPRIFLEGDTTGIQVGDLVRFFQADGVTDLYEGNVSQRVTGINDLGGAVTTQMITLDGGRLVPSGSVLRFEKRINYKVEKCVVNEASIDFDIDGIATINWSGLGQKISETGNVSTTVYEGVTSTSNFIRNRLTTLAIKAADEVVFPGNDGEGRYETVLTGGNVTISNNITFLTPETMGLVNQPLGHVTGTRTVSGSFTCYLNNDAGSSADLFEDVHEARTTITNDFNLTFGIGGDSAIPRCSIILKHCHLELPTHSLDDVISLEVNFHALPSSIANADEAIIAYKGA